MTRTMVESPGHTLDMLEYVRRICHADPEHHAVWNRLNHLINIQGKGVRLEK
jgi:hypothetical protein